MDIRTYLQWLLAHSGLGSFGDSLPGHGMDILDLRKYQVGDAVRYINRKQTAKHDQAIVNIYEDTQESWLQCFLDINYNWLGVWHDVWLRTIVENFFVELLRHTHHLGVRVDICRYADGALQTIIAKDYRQIASLIQSHIGQQKPVYSSALYPFAQGVLWQKKRRWILLFSDFLEPLDVQVYHDLEVVFPTYLVSLPISQLEGKNFVGL